METDSGNYARSSKYPTLNYEFKLWQAGCLRVAGIDEAGRGAWAGPVYAAAVILPVDQNLSNTLGEVRDSKQMTAQSRQAWAPIIREVALAWGIGFASAGEIDALGIVPATKLAGMRALRDLDRGQLTVDHYSTGSSPDPLPTGCLFPDYLLTDYLVFPNLELPQTALVKGDQLSLSIATASVLAKTARDALMREMDDLYPAYGFARHKGYGTRFHQEAIRRFGLSEIHRKSFSISL